MIKSIKRFDEFLDSVINYIDRYSILYIIVLVIINLVIKLLYAGDMPYWLDETSSISIAQSTFSEIIEKSLGDPNTPLYFILLKGWMAVFGISEFSTRLLSVIFSASTIIPLYYLGRRFFNLETAILVTLIFAVSHIHVFFSHETRGYTLISLMETL